jgi:hypothetical protein
LCQAHLKEAHLLQNHKTMALKNHSTLDLSYDPWP